MTIQLPGGGRQFETRQLHSGAVPDPASGARAVPIHQTAGYVYRDTAHAAAAFELADLTTHAYTRLSNPTTAVAEERIAALEGGAAAVAVAGGQAATSLALLNLARTGDHRVARQRPRRRSGGSHRPCTPPPSSCPATAPQSEESSSTADTSTSVPTRTVGPA